MGYVLVCKICNCPINLFDYVESKASGAGPKLYHTDCYEEAHLDIEYTEETLRDILMEYGREELKMIFWEFDLEAPEGWTDEELIDGILIEQIEAVRKDRNA